LYRPTTGSCFAEDPTRSAVRARLFWQPEIDAAVLKADASVGRADDPDTLDLLRQPGPVTILHPAGGGTELLLGPYGRRMRISIASKVDPARPLRLDYRLGGHLELERPLLTLRRFSALMRRGSCPVTLFPQEPQTRRWTLLLTTLDGLAGGASHRQIAIGLFGRTAVEQDWTGRSDYLRLRVRRLVAAAHRLANGAYLGLLGR
jgi:hypothetical protein